MSKTELVSGVENVGRHLRYHKKGIWALKNKKTEKKAAKAKVAKASKSKKVNGAKNGGERVIATGPSWYPTEKAAHPLANHKKNGIAKLRPSLTPGTIVILLAGRFRGKKAVFLKQLASGLLLVSGPFQINGVPLRRVNQRYVIATSTKVDLGDFTVDAKFNDAYFKKPKAAKATKGEDQFFKKGKDAAKNEVSAERKQDQKDVDAAIVGAVKAVALLPAYLKARFSLKKGQYPHELVF